MVDLALKHVSKSFGDTEVIKDVSINIEDKDFVVFVGPSGCGKSTLLRLIAGLESISQGDLFIGKERVNSQPPAKRGIAMVFQSYALYPHMTVFKNMAFGLSIAKEGREVIKEKVRKAAAALELEHLLERRPSELSGGQRQRVAIGRAIVRSPQVFLFDEPLSNLDASLRVQTRLEIAKLHQELDATMIYVTHDQVEAMTLATKIVVLRAGRVEQVGTPMDLFHNPANIFVAGFIGSPSMNFVQTTVSSTVGSAVTLAYSGDSSVDLQAADYAFSAGENITLGIRPDHLQVGDGQAFQLRGKVFAIEQLGDTSYVYLELADGGGVTVAHRGQLSFAKGDEIVVSADLDSVHMFAADEQAISRIVDNKRYSL